MSLIKLILDEAHAECEYCGGLGYVYNHTSKKDPMPKLHCFDCHGRGWKLSDMGQLLADTLRAGLDPHYAPASHHHDHNP